MTHPLAFKDNRGGFTDGNGNEVREGDKVLYAIGHRRAVLHEALHDGDAFITFEDGTFGTVKWRLLCKLVD